MQEITKMYARIASVETCAKEIAELYHTFPDRYPNLHNMALFESHLLL
jgi:hypothetical protein